MKPCFFALLLLSSLSLQAGVTMVSGTVYDVGKGSHSYDGSIPSGTKESDSQMCWAAASANVIQHWQDTYGAPNGAPNGYASTVYSYPTGTRYLAISEYFRESFTNTGGNLYNAANWYFNGIKFTGANKTAPGYLNNKTISVYSKDSTTFATIAAFQEELATPFQSEGIGVVLSLGGTSARGDAIAHAITCWGYETDAAGHITALYVADSDDLQYGPLRVNLVGKDGKVYITTNYTDGIYNDGGEYYLNGLSYLKYSKAEALTANNTLESGATVIDHTTDATGADFSSPAGLTVQAGAILAASGTRTSLTLGVDSGTAEGNGLAAEVGALVSLNQKDIRITGFSGQGIEAGCEVYFIGGSLDVSGNAGAGILVSGTKTDPKCFLQVSGNSSVSISGNGEGGLHVCGGRLDDPDPTKKGYYHAGNGDALFLSNGTVSFTDNRAEAGGAVYATGIARFQNNEEAVFSGNSSKSKGGAIAITCEPAASRYYVGRGGISGNSSVSIDNNSTEGMGGALYIGGAFDISGNGSISISGNSADKGAAIYATTDLIPAASKGYYYTSPASVRISDNTSLSITGNSATTSDIIYNKGALLSISGNESVLITDNNAVSGTEGLDGYVIYNGGCKCDIPGTNSYMPINSPVLEIARNQSFVFDDNLAEFDIYNEGRLYLSAEAGCNINFQHGIKNAAGSHANAASNITAVLGQDSNGTAGAGNFVFADDNRKVTMGTTLTTVSAEGALVWGDEHTFSVSNAEMVDSYFTLSGVSLSLDNVTISSGLTVNFGNYDQQNTLSMTKTTVSTGAAFSMVLSLGFTYEQSSAPSITVTLADYLDPKKLSGFSSVTVTLTDALARTAQLVVDTTGFADSTVLLVDNYDLSKTDGNLRYYKVKKELPTSLVWSNGNGDFVWDKSTLNWKAGEDDDGSTYLDRIKISFDGTGAGVIVLMEDVSPISMVVDNPAGQDYEFTGDGSFTGAMTLTKRGEGSITLSNNNNYSGDTVIEEGVVVINNAHAFGGLVLLKGGTIDLNSMSAPNSITATGGTLANAGNFCGALTVTGDLTLSGDAAAASLTIKNGTVHGNISTAAVNLLSSSGSSTVDGDLTLDGGTWICQSGSPLTVTGSLIISGATALDLSAFEVSDELYTLARFQNLSGDLGLLDLALVPGRKFALSQSDTELLLRVSTKNVTLVWTAPKGVWQEGGATAWGIADNSTNDPHFHNCSEVLFNIKSTVTITGEVAPESVRVENMGKNAVTFSGKGSITGSGSLTMDGTGTLKLNAANAYSGGTVINSGTVTATGNTSFGTGAITLNGGTLNLGGKAVANDIEAHGGLLTGATKYAGTLTVADSLDLKGNLLAKSVTVDGTLKAGTIKDTAITLESGSITSAISGKSSVLVTGEASLTGKLSYTGGTTLVDGKLTSDFTLAAKQTLTATTGTFGANLTLSGGSILLADDMSLTVSNALVLKKASTLDVSSLDGSATISFASLTGDTTKFLKLSAPTEGRKSYDMTVSGKTITVTASGSNTDLTWNAPKGKGKWEVAGKQTWDGSTDDNRFYHGDNVTFNAAASVTLATKLAPGSVTVTGDGAVTFSGSGSIAGDAALTMNGSSTLKLNANNAYTGGTIINSGTVIATGVDSFGKGDITLSGGTLNLSKKAVKNNIVVKDNATILNAKGFAGTITVKDGATLSLKDSLTGTLVLNGGTLDLSGVKNIAKMTFGTVIVGEEETDIVDASGQHYTFDGNKLVKDGRLIATAPAPQPQIPGAAIYTTQMRAQIDGNRAAFDSIRQMMGCTQPTTADGKYRFAVQATNANSHQAGYDRNGFGGLVMAEEVFSDKAVGGLSLGYEHADIRPEGADKYESDDTRVNAHLLVSTKHWQSRSIAGVGIHDYRINRSSAVSTGHSLNLMQEVSRTIALNDRNIVSPFVRVETGYNVIGSCNDGALTVGKQHAWATELTFGARYVHGFRYGTLMLEAGATKSIGDLGGNVTVNNTALTPADAKRWSATLGGSVQIPVGKRSAINAGANARLHGGATEVNANVGYSIKF